MEKLDEQNLALLGFAEVDITPGSLLIDKVVKEAPQFLRTATNEHSVKLA